MAWTPVVGEICMHARTHHPALKPLAGPVRVVRIIESGSCWVQPLGPVRERRLRNGRTVIERPTYEQLVAPDHLEPLTAEQAAAVMRGDSAPVLWMLHDHGFDLHSIRRRETE